MAKPEAMSFEHKLEVMAKAFFRDRDEDSPWETWKDALEEMRDNVSDQFVETCYRLSANDPEVNTEAMN